MERLKAQRAARVGPAAATRPSALSSPRPTVPPAGAAALRPQQPSAVPPLPQPAVRPLPTRAATIHASPPLQPFHSPPRSDERSPYPPDSASAYPTSFSLPADHYPPGDGDDYAVDEAHSPRPWHDGFSYVGPAGAALRTPSRSSGRTVLHEAHGRAAALGIDGPDGGAPPRAGPPSRAELLEWERARREGRDEVRARGGSPAVRERLDREEDVRSSWGWEEATEGLRDPGRSTVSDLEEEDRSEVRVDEILMQVRLSSLPRALTSSECELLLMLDSFCAQDWLLQPPPDRPVTDGLLSFPDMWYGVYAVLTPSHFYLLHDADANADAQLAFAVHDVVAVERISKHARDGFEPFFVEVRGGDKLYFAGMEKLDAELWSLKIKCVAPFLCLAHPLAQS